MKQKKTLLKKFHRKYVFLQNSLVHFLDWRVSELPNVINLTTHNNQKKSLFMKNKKNTVDFLEQEKICFQDYWKSSEHKKLENAIHNINVLSIQKKSFFVENRKKNLSIFSEIEQDFHKNLYIPTSLASGMAKMRLTQSKSVSTNRLNLQTVSKMLQSRQSSAYFAQLENNFSKQSEQSKNLFSKQLLKNKYSKILEKVQLLSFNTLETFIPKSDICRRQNFFFVNQKIGEFFPKKKNFTQYWIFPLLGFVIFFYSTPTFFDTRFKQILEKSFSSPFHNDSFNVYKQQTTKNLLTFPIYSKFSSSFFPISWKDQQKNFLQETKLKQKNLNIILDFSYTNEFSKNTYNQLKKLENDEFEKYCDFSFKIFQNSPHFFIFDLLNKATSNHEKKFQSLLYFYNKNSFKKDIYRKMIETKRNTFHWKWFSLNSQSFDFLEPNFFSWQVQPHGLSVTAGWYALKKNKAFYFDLLEIPQKAQFFYPIFENSYHFLSDSNLDFTLQKSQKLPTSMNLTFQPASFFTDQRQTDKVRVTSTVLPFSKTKILTGLRQQSWYDQRQAGLTGVQKFISSQTPLLNFSKTMFLFNEFERNLNNFFHIEFSNKKENFHFLNDLVSLSEKRTENSNFPIFEKWNNSFFEFSKNSSLFDINTLKNFSQNSLNSDQNSFYLTKWLQTQNFWKVKKIDNSLKLFSNFSNLKQKNTVQNSKTFEKFINIENCMNLDFIYFRKLCFSLYAPKKQFQKKKIETFITLSNFSQFLKSNMHNKSSLTHIEKNFSNAVVYKKKTPYSFDLTKQTFQFFIFQHYKYNYKKFMNNLLSSNKSNKSNKQENKRKSTNFIQQNSINLENKFHQNLFTKNENTNEKKILSDFKNFSKINSLNIPIYLNFSNKKTIEKLDIHFQKENTVFSKNQIIFPYVSLISKHENLEARSNSLSSIYFHLLNNQKISLIRQSFFYSKTFFKSKINIVQTIYEKTLTNIKKNKFLFFSRLQLESFSFQNHFLFEKIKKEKPLIFKNHEKFNPLIFFSSSLKTKIFLFKSTKFFVFKEKLSDYFSDFTCSHQRTFMSEPGQKASMTRKQKNQLVNQRFTSFFVSNKSKSLKFKNYLNNFQSRKYEKIFKTFLKPLNKEKTININKLAKKRKILSKFKTSKDVYILQSLSASAKENFINSKSPFFISFDQITSNPQNNVSTTIQNSNLYSALRTNFQEKIQSTLFSTHIEKNQQIKTRKKLNHQNSKKLLLHRTTNVLYPSFILKRDGFVFFPSYMPSDIIQTQTQQKAFSKERALNADQQIDIALAQVKTTGIRADLTNSFSTQKMRETNVFTLKRLEHEKSLQKKRRMKKQKLETRRRKKRKRFFPRPVWLRFYLYKKFLKTRHPHLWSNFSISLENEKNTSQSSIDKQSVQSAGENFKISNNLAVIPKNIFVLFPKKTKYQNIKAFSKNKTNSFIFHFSNRKKWKNILYSSHFKKTLWSQHFHFHKKAAFSQKVFHQSILSTMTANNIFLNKNSHKNFSTVFKKFSEKNSIPKISKTKSHSFYTVSLKNHNKFSENKIYRKNKQNWGFFSKKNYLAFSEKFLYKKFENNLNFSNRTNRINKFSPISQNLEHYKISGEILSEFVRLSWKSYWFLTNFQPYTKRITQNFRKMQKVESEKNFSNFLTILLNNKSPMLFQSLPVFQNHFSNNSQNLLLRNSVFKKFHWYCNIKNSLEAKGVIGTSFNELNQKSLNYQNIQNFPEYNRILYSRVSEILRNFKSLENTDDQFLHIRDQKKSNIPQRKNEIISSNSSFFTKNALFFENFHIPSQPSIPAFSIFSSIFNDFSIKPTGEIPTLRSLWALHQTNFYHFQEKNAVRHLWTLKKRTDNLKSLKGTKKAVHFFRKYSGLEKLNSLQLLNFFTLGEQPANNFIEKNNEFFKKDHFQFIDLAKTRTKEEFSNNQTNFRWQAQDQKIYPFVKKSNFLIFKNLTNKKKFFVSNLKSHFHDFVQQLDIASVQKFLNSEKKCSLFGIHTVQQNSKISLRFLKYHLYSNTSKQNFMKSFKTGHRIANHFDTYIANERKQNTKLVDKKSTSSQNIEQLENTFVLKNKNLNIFFSNRQKAVLPQNSSKSSLNFWWSQKNLTGFDFFMNSQYTRLNSLQFVPFFSLSQQTEKIVLNNQNSFFANFNFPFSQIELNKTNKNKYFSIQTQFLWFGAMIFHLAIFFTILKLPEIRSVLKFQCILFSKFFASFFFIIFSIYNFFKKYTQKGSFVAKKILSNTSSLKKNKSFDVFSFDLEHSSKFQNFIFSRNKNLQEKKLVNLLFYLKDNRHLNNSLTSYKSYFSIFELFVRLSKFSSLFSKNKYLNKYKKYTNLNLFFISIHNFYNLKNFYSLEKIVENKIFATKNFLKISKNIIVPITQKFPMTFLKNSKSIFHFQNSSRQVDRKNTMNLKPHSHSPVLWQPAEKNSISNDFLLSFYSYAQTSFTSFPIELNTFAKQLGNRKFTNYSQSHSDKFSKQKFLFSTKSYNILNKARHRHKNKEKLTLQNRVNKNSKNKLVTLVDKKFTHSRFASSNSSALSAKFAEKVGWQVTEAKRLQQNFQTLSTNEKFICELALSFLFLGKSTTILTSKIVQFGTNVSSKILDLFETIMFSIYKFLEKPAEVFIEWIALIFLIEWSSDIVTFVPDTLDISLTKSFQKFNRPVRSSSFFLDFLNSRNENMLFYFYTYYGSNFPGSLANFFGFWSYVNLTSFILQKRMIYFFENFCSTILQPDMDLLTRQRKGIIFWDIWAEILLKAAEKYNVNIPSFVTLKEEQELFIEKLLQDKEFLNNLQNQTQQYKAIFYREPAWLSRIQQSAYFTDLLVCQPDSKSIFANTNRASFSKGFTDHESKTTFTARQQPQTNIALHKKVVLSEQSKTKWLENWIDILKKKAANVDKQKTLNGENIEQNSFILFIENFIEKERFQQFYEFSSLSESQNVNKNINSFNNRTDFHYSTKFDRSSTYEGNQSGTYQGPETDLFIDIHPPKSLKHIQFSKYYEPAQYTLGSLICQVYSGLFSKQISKNILVIGAPGTAKTLFIQALAGETEMKMITDNAYRYSMVLRGVAVGMKYLRDVFDALALQTPCFFLMEHIHVLGSKRPFLISDDENIKGIQANVGLEQQEVHETNQMIYQLNRHSVVDFKRPYKGDFSMGIPTNFFVQSFYSNFENNSNSIFLSAGSTRTIKNSIFSTGSINTQNRNPISPLPVDSIEHSLMKQGFAEKEKTDNAFQNSENSQKQYSFQSRLQMAQEQIFAPPATSPFTILMMKEQKKLKPKKIVQESSWGGLSTDQFISYQKESSSVRAKVALLADITMNLSRGKLDMITDLLVIIDSVRSNRGFVVFATTHLPSLLDPALRRPGRFDETISLSQSPNFLNRFEILKTNFQNSLTTLDFLDSSIFTENLSEMNLLNFITGTKLSFFHQYKYTSLQKVKKLTPKFIHKEKKLQQKFISQIYPTKALHNFLKSSFFYDLYCKKSKIHHQNSEQNLHLQSAKYFLRNLKLLRYTVLPKKPSHILNFAYSKIGIFLAQSNLLQDPTAFTPLSLDTHSSFVHGANKNIQFLGNVLYDSQKQQKLQFMMFLSGKIAEFCFQKNTINSFQYKKFETVDSTVSSAIPALQALLAKQNWQDKQLTSTVNLAKQNWQLAPLQSKVDHLFLDFVSAASQSKIDKCIFPQRQYKQVNRKLTSSLQKTDLYWTTFGNDQIWRFLTPFLFSIIQKRFLFTKNLLLSKMLFFDNKNTRKLPPSPPSSSILMPSKKFENFKRTENDFVQKPRFSINEKIQMHQQQRFLKQLYNIPIQQYFRSEMIENRTTLFSSSFQELAYLDSLTRRFSSSYFYQRKYLVIRHRFSNTNQWWNGLLPEHNTETTFLSDVDWRTMFGNTISKQKYSQLLKSFQNISFEQKTLSKEKDISTEQLMDNKFMSQSNKLVTSAKTQNVFSEKEKNQTFEFIMDFPDAEQYYNPRNRRWYFNSHFHKKFHDAFQMSSFVNDKKKFQSVVKQIVDQRLTSKQNHKTALLNKSHLLKNISIDTFDIHENSSYWLTFDKTLQYEIYYHYLMQSFHESFHYFNTHREMLDLFVFQLLRKGFLKELDYLMTISRFKNI